jgi:hypothetical protein
LHGFSGEENGIFRLDFFFSFFFSNFPEDAVVALRFLYCDHLGNNVGAEMRPSHKPDCVLTWDIATRSSAVSDVLRLLLGR